MNSSQPIDLGRATDAELVQLCRRGDQSAYGQIVQRYQTLACSIGYNRCGDLALSEDLAQDGFILAWQKLGDLKDGSKFKSWICSIVRNLASRSSQRSRRSVAYSAAPLDAVGDVPSQVESPHQRAVSAEEEKLVWEALADVPQTFREPLILFYREDQSVARVAQALDLSEDAVKQRLSRGRNMLRRHLATVVEAALVVSKPAQAFTGAVLLGISGATAKTASAAALTTATATVAKPSAGAAAGSGLGSLFLGPILKLPVIAWMLKTAIDQTRSQRERQLMHRYLLCGLAGVVIYVAALVSSFWWQQYVEPPLLRSLLPGAMMVVFLIPWIVLARRFAIRVERLRKQEGTFTPPRPLVQSTTNGPIARRAYGLFCLSSLLVVAGPAVMALVARDGWAFSAILASALGIGLVAAQLSLRLPRWSFQWYTVGTGLPAIVTICIILFRRSLWASASVDAFPWFIGSISALTLTLGILTTIAWKRVYGRPESADESM